MKTHATAMPVMLALALSLTAISPAAPALLCGDIVKSGEASGKTIDESHAAATAWWSSRAGALGSGYQSWDNAKDKSFKCNDGPGGTKRCIASARPCLKDGQLPQGSDGQSL